MVMATVHPYAGKGSHCSVVANKLLINENIVSSSVVGFRYAREIPDMMSTSDGEGVMEQRT